MSTQSILSELQAMEMARGEAALCWLGQMGFLIRLGDTLLCVDYFASLDPNRLKQPPIPVAELTGVDIFLGTHDHGDHIDRPAWQIWQDACPEALFVAPAVHVPSLVSEGIKAERLIGMNDGGIWRYGDITIRALAAAHEFLDRDDANGLYPHLQYIIEGNGVRIHHAGDTLVYDGMAGWLCEQRPLDIMILPINGRDGERYRLGCIGNMTYQEAADLAGTVAPDTVIPAHWDMFANNLGDPSAFADLLDAKFSGKVRCLMPICGTIIRYGRKA